jgi:hypothetical protein
MQSECHNLSAKQEGITWIRKAAEQGDLDAQAALGPLLTNDDDKGLELLQPVARRGHAIAQSLCARYCWSKRQGHDDADAVIWATLAAAQGHVEAYYDLGNDFMEVATATATSSDTSSHRTGTGDDDNGPTDSDFMLCRTLYWYKKAALQAYPPAQAATIQHLIQIKKSLFDGVANQVGYSCLPETVFWNRQAQGDGPRAPFDFEYLLQACGCCGSRPGSKRRHSTQGVARDSTGTASAAVADDDDDDIVDKIHRCLQCQSIGYCSRECQSKHWKMGHKADCLHVKELKAAMKL